MNPVTPRRSSVNISRSRRALVQPRFLLAMTAMASAVGGVSYLATAQNGRAPVKMTKSSGVRKSKAAKLSDLPDLVRRAGATGRLGTKRVARSGLGRTAQAVTNGNGITSGFNLGEIDLTPGNRIPANGNNPETFSGSPSDERDPAFSPLGDLIAFRSNGADNGGDGTIDAVNGNGRYHIWVMNADGSEQRQVTGFGADASRNQMRPSWSSEGLLVYVDERVPSNMGGPTADQLFVVNPLNGSSAVPEQRTFFAGDKKSPVFDPSGSAITFACKSDPTTGINRGQFDLYSIEPGGDGATAVRLTGGADDPGGNNTDDLNPAYSPGSTNTLYFSSNRDGGAKISGRRIWRINGGAPVQVTDPSQRQGFRDGDNISDDFPTVSLAKDFSNPNFFGESTTPTNDANRNLTEQLAFQTNSRLNDSDVNLDLNIWDLPTSAGREGEGEAFILTNSLSSPDTAQPGLIGSNGPVGGEDFAPDREPTFNRSILSPQSVGTLAFASQRRVISSPGATTQNPTGGNGTGATNDIFTTGTVDTTPPLLVPQSIGNQEFPVVSPTATIAGQGQGNPRTFEAGLRAGAEPGTPGSLKIGVVMEEREAGLARLGSVQAVIRNADIVEVNTGLEFGFFPDPTSSPVNEEIRVQVARERDNEQANTYALTAVDNGSIASGGSEMQAGAVAGDGIYYCFADVKTPNSGEFYMDIVATDLRQNTFTYDNIWGFATRKFGKFRPDLLVSDYTVGQLFPNVLSGAINFSEEAGDDARFANMFPVESYLIKANGQDGRLGAGATADGMSSGQGIANAFPTADVYRTLCRGPITAAQLSVYKPVTKTQIDPNETPVQGRQPFTARTRRVAVAGSSVTWAAPYAGTIFGGVGTLVEATTQRLLTDFSNSGGRLFVMGRDIGFGLTSGGTVSSDFMSTALGADWGGDVQTGSGSGLDPGVVIVAEQGDFIKSTLSYGIFTNQDRRNLQVPFHYERKDVLTDNWDDAALNLNPNTASGSTSEGSGSTFFRQAVGVQPDELRRTAPAGATIQDSYSIGGRIVGQRMVRQTGSIESRSVAFGFGLESINRRWRKRTQEFGLVALNARAAVVRGVQSFLKTGSLSGQVVNFSTNRPIANFLVRVTLETDDSVVYLARTDANGNYKVEGLGETSGSGGYRVEPAVLDNQGRLLPSGTSAGANGAQTSPPGFFSGTVVNTVEIVGGSDTPGVNLKPIEIRPGSVTGRVVTTDTNDPTKRVPANGLYVLIRSVQESSIFPGGGQFADVQKTDATGNFSFARVPALIDLEVILNPVLDDIPVKSGLRSNFVPPAFTGTFQNPVLGRRLVKGLGRPNSTDTSVLQVGSGQTFVLNDSNPDAAPDSGTPLLLARFSATLSGKVNVNRVAAGDVTVQLFRSTDTAFRSPLFSTITDFGGNYSLTNVSAGTYLVKATTKLGATANVSVTVTNNSGTTDVAIRVPEINITAPKLSGKVNLRIVGVTTRVTPLARATVELLTNAGRSFSPAITTTTGSSGTYSFNVAPNGAYQVRATADVDGNITTTAPSTTVTVTRDMAAPDLVITRFEISGTVRRSTSNGGGVQSRAIVELVQGDNTLRSIISGTDGSFVFSNLLPGNYRVQAFASATTGAPSGSTAVTIAANATKVEAIEVTLDGTGPVINPTDPRPTPTPRPTQVPTGPGSVGRTFAANQTFNISLPYTTNNIVRGTVTVKDAFGSGLFTSGAKLYFFDAAGQRNRLVRGLDLKEIKDESATLTRGVGYILITGSSAVEAKTRLQNSNLNSFSGTEFPIELVWNRTFLSDTSEPNNRNNGYNLIGFPFDPSQFGSVSFPDAKVTYGSTTYESISEASSAGIIDQQLYTYTSDGVRTPVNFGDRNLKPFQGYFVHILRNDQKVTLTLRNPIK